MAKQIVMDTSGDTRHEFDPADTPPRSQKPWRGFKALTGAGFTAAVRAGPGTSELVRDFDPAADEVEFFPRLRRRKVGTGTRLSTRRLPGKPELYR